MYRKGIPEVKFVSKIFRQLNALSGGGGWGGAKNMISACEREKANTDWK